MAGRTLPGRVLTDAGVRDLGRDKFRAALRHSGGKIYGPVSAAESVGPRPTTRASRMKAPAFQADKAPGGRSRPVDQE